MPVITKLSPNKKPLATRDEPSILSQAIDVQDLELGFIKMVIFGMNGVGKTYLAAMFPKPLLVVSTEPSVTGGAISIQSFKGVKLVRLKDHRKLMRLASELKTNNPFKTIVLDSITSLQDIVLKHILNLPEIPVMNSWGKVSDDEYRERAEVTRETMRPFLDLECHTILTAKEKDMNAIKDRKPKLLKQASITEHIEESGNISGSYLAPELGGTTVGWVLDYCDYACRLYRDKETKTRTVKKKNLKGVEKLVTETYETGKIVRRLRTGFHPNIAARFRAEDESKVPDYIENPTFEKIEAVIKGLDLSKG